MSEPAKTSYWRPCSTCKSPLALGGKHYVCSVSTCNTRRTAYVFCSVECFERHLPGARHKDAFAVEEKTPLQPHPPVSVNSEASARSPQRRIVRPNIEKGAKPATAQNAPKEILIVASRLKDYILNTSEMNTSASVMDVLSDHIRDICDQAIDQARADGRKTVMDRDFQFLRSGLKR